MQLTKAFTYATLAMAVAAAPGGSKGGNGGNNCPVKSANKCCNGFQQKQSNNGILDFFNNIGQVGLGCVPIIGEICKSGSAACCSNQNQGLIVIDICQIAFF